MLELSRELKPEEEKLLAAQLRNENINYWINIFKTIVLVCTIIGSAIGSAWLYFDLNKPQADRERIKLVLEILKEKDPFIQKIGMEMVTEVYPTESSRLKEIDKKIIDNTTLKESEMEKNQAEREFDKSQNPEEKKLIEENLRKINNKINEINSAK